MQVCPTDALVRDKPTGSVIVRYPLCIGCTVCAMACPFGIITFHRVSQTVSRPRSQRQVRQLYRTAESRKIPACAEACKTGALEFGDANDLIRVSRKDFTLRMLKSEGTDVEVPRIPENVRAFRAILKELAEMS